MFLLPACLSQDTVRSSYLEVSAEKPPWYTVSHLALHITCHPSPKDTQFTASSTKKGRLFHFFFPNIISMLSRMSPIQQNWPLANEFYVLNVEFHIKSRRGHRQLLYWSHAFPKSPHVWEGQGSKRALGGKRLYPLPRREVVTGRR